MQRIPCFSRWLVQQSRTDRLVRSLGARARSAFDGRTKGGDNVPSERRAAARRTFVFSIRTDEKKGRYAEFRLRREGTSSRH